MPDHQTITPTSEVPDPPADNVAGLIQATPDPPLVAIPNDDPYALLPHPWPADDQPDMYGRTAPITVNPVPIIGAIGYGGRVMGVGREDLAIGGSMQIGPRGTPRPQVTELLVTPAGLDVDIVAAAGQISRGLSLIGGDINRLALSTVILQNNGAAPTTVSWAVIGYDPPE
jgi:hypothetical protein